MTRASDKLNSYLIKKSLKYQFNMRVNSVKMYVTWCNIPVIWCNLSITQCITSEAYVV